MFELGPAELKSLARALPEAELATLSGYLTGLAAKPREIVLRTMAAAPAKMKILASHRVREAVLASRNQATAVDMMLRTSVDTPGDILGDIRQIVDGAVSPILMWERHPIVAVLAIIPVLVLFMLLRRIFVPRRKPRAPPPSAPPQQAA